MKLTLLRFCKACCLRPVVSYLLFGLAALNISAQNTTVSGHVLSAVDRFPISGVTIAVKGAAVSVSTGEKGEFTIAASAGSVLEVSHVGYRKKEVTLTGQQNITITLDELKDSLDEVVVIGYGRVKKRDLTGSVSTIKSDAFANVPVASIDQMLQGKAAGMEVTSISGQPGDGTTIRIRGGNSINGSNEPLYVIDGILAGDGFNTNLLNPEDVESIEILKDASSTAIYGARGSNGVIIITTKTGKPGRDRVSMNMYTGFQEIPHLIPMMDGKEYAALVNEQYISQGKPAYFKNLDTLANTDWQKEITRRAVMTSANIQASGADKKSSYLLSGNYLNQDGVVLNSGFRRYQFRLNMARQILSTVKVTGTLNVGNSLTKNNPASLGGLDYYSSALGVAPTMAIYQADGTFTAKREVNSGNLDHPLAQATLIKNQTIRNNVLGNMAIEWTPLAGFVIKSTWGTQLNFIKNNYYLPGTMPVEKINLTGGTATVSTSQEIMWQMENTVSYTKKIKKHHNIDVVGGITYQTGSIETLSGTSKKFANDSQEYNNLGATDQTTFALGSGYTGYSMVSYLARLNYAYKGKYLLTVSDRIDGSSRFAVNNKYATFPAAAIAWRASDETFIKNLHLFSNLKLRASYGVVGNQAIPSYASLPTLNAARYIFNNINTLGYVQGNYGNPNLRWERTTQFDLGLEMGFLNNRITLETDLYSKTTEALLLSEQLPVQTGFTSLSTNKGNVRNQGIEFLVNTVNITGKDFRWSTSFNISTNRNKVLDLGGVPEILTQNITYAGNVSRLELGQQTGLFWGAQYYGTRKTLAKVDGAVGKNAAAPVLGEPLYYDRSGDGLLGTDDYTVIGDANASFFGGMGNTFNYKRFELNFYVSFSQGNQVMNIADNFYNSGDPLSNNYKTMVNRWSPSNPNSNIPTLARDYVPSTRWIYDGSFLRLKSLSIGYNIPGRVMKASWIRNVNIYVSGSNLFLLTSYPYYDPETNYYGTSSTVRGFDATNYPQNRSYVGGIKIDF